jgi:DNA-binding NtrC family response regulator
VPPKNSPEKKAAKDAASSERPTGQKAQRPRLHLILPTPAMEVRVAIIDDDDAVTLYLSEYFSEKGFKVATFSAAEEALSVLSRAAADQAPCPFDLIFSDVQMPHMDGIELTKKVKTLYPDIPIVLVTAFGEIEQAVNSIRDGAFDYLEKPLDLNRLEIVIRNALDARSLRIENESFRRGRFTGLKYGGVLCKSPAMESIYELVTQVSSLDVPVLIQGEHGVGKEQIAHAIHQSGKRANKKLVRFDCAATPESLQESELFAEETGAFLDASEGVLLLEQIESLSLAMQTKIWHALQEKVVRPLGSDNPVPADVRIIATSRGNLEKSVTEYKFREDLFYRISTLYLHVPPLRHRVEDIPALAEHFLAASLQKAGSNSRGFTKSAMDKLQSLRFKDNVQELKDLIERTAQIAQGPWIDAKDIPITEDAESEELALVSKWLGLRRAGLSTGHPESDLVLSFPEQHSY